MTENPAPVLAQRWQPIDTAPRNVDAIFWIVPKTPDESYVDTSGTPIVAKFTPFAKQTRYGWWTSLSKATHWMPLPDMSAPLVPPDGTAQLDDQGDHVCQHGVAMDVHCCNCHSGFLFDYQHVCEPELPDGAVGDLLAYGREESDTALTKKDRDAHQFWQGWCSALERLKVGAPDGAAATMKARLRKSIDDWRAAAGHCRESCESTAFYQGEDHGYALCYDECAGELEAALAALPEARRQEERE